MTAIERVTQRSSSTRYPATRKDLLGVGCLTGTKRSHSGVVATQQWLMDLGFHIHQANPRHWVLTLSAPLPQLHFYSEAELEQFAANRAQLYARAHTKEAS